MEANDVLAGAGDERQQSLDELERVNTTASVPSENGRLNRRATFPSASAFSRPLATGGRAR